MNLKFSLEFKNRKGGFYEFSKNFCEWTGYKLIRDAKDQPILNAAIGSDVDIILTFLESEGVEE